MWVNLFSDEEPVVSPAWPNSIKKCKKGLVHSFKRILILLRDPYASIWSEYQRRESMAGEHNTGISKNTFNVKSWELELMNNFVPEFKSLYENVFEKIISSFDSKNYLVTTYESLRLPDRVEVIRNITTFMGYNATQDRLDCSFEMADNPLAHRSINMSTMVKIDQAYASEKVVCAMWKILSNGTSLHQYG